MYTKLQFGKDLKNRINKKQNIEEIASWSYTIHLEYFDVNDKEFLDLLLRLSMMELGIDFALTYEELDEIADKLIADNDLSSNS